MRTKNMYVGQKVKSIQNNLHVFYIVKEIKKGGWVVVTTNSGDFEYTARVSLFVSFDHSID